MASESENSRNPQNFSLFLPFILGLNPRNPSQENPQIDETARESRDRIILINPISQTMVVIESSSSNNSSSLGFDSLIDDLFSQKIGRPPASKASIDALKSVEIDVNCGDDEQCVVCLEDWESGEKAKEMPCKHKFHGNCIEKWLKIHGSCPVCRYEMPVDEADDEKKRRGVWVGFGPFGFVSDRRSESNENSGDSLTSDEESQ